jgi:hypothetical protein
MPIILTPDLEVINGIGRLEMLAEKRQKTAPVVFIDRGRAELARAMLNLLSMDFDIHTTATRISCGTTVSGGLAGCAPPWGAVLSSPYLEP